MNRVSYFNLMGCLLLAALAVGCDTPAAPEFHLNMVQMTSDATPTPEAYQQDIANLLDAMFGTPDKPFALPETGLDNRKLQMAAGAAWSDKAGANYGLYRKHCVHCHGISGDGRGPTALFLNPYPRDYRPGVYKFKSTYNASKPTDEDLHRVLVNGVPGTAMPSFSLLPEAEVEALVEYVKYLSYRGQMETSLTTFAFDVGEQDKLDDKGNVVLNEEDEPVKVLTPIDPVMCAEEAAKREAQAAEVRKSAEGLSGDAKQEVIDRADALQSLADDLKSRRVTINESMMEIVDGWAAANDEIIVPTPESIPSDDRTPDQIAESVAKGRELFFGVRANCVKCHGPTGLGDGQQDDQDIWNKANKTFLESIAKDPENEMNAEREEVAATLFPVRNAIPRNLRLGGYRGGNRRIDIFWKIYAGIPGTPMPASGPAAPGGQGTITEEEMWQIVDYVLSLPYEMPSRPLEALPTNLELVNQ